jgi:hypothetical protein
MTSFPFHVLFVTYTHVYAVMHLNECEQTPSRGAQDRWLALSPVARVALYNEMEREIFRLMDSAVRGDFLLSPFFRQYVGAPIIGSLPSSPLSSPLSSNGSNGMPFPPAASLSLTHPPHHGHAHGHQSTMSHGNGSMPSARGISAAQAQSAGARPAKQNRVGNIITGSNAQTRTDTRPMLAEDMEAASMDDFARSRFRPPSLQPGSKGITIFPPSESPFCACQLLAYHICGPIYDMDNDIADRLLGGGVSIRPAPRSITPGVLPSQSSSIIEEDDRLRSRSANGISSNGHTTGNGMVSSSSAGSLHHSTMNGTTNGYGINTSMNGNNSNGHRVMAGTHGTIYQSAAMPSLPGAYRVGTNPPLLPATSFAHVHSTLALRALESLAAAGSPPPQQQQQPPGTSAGGRPAPLLPELSMNQSSPSSTTSQQSSSMNSRPTSAARGTSPTRLMRQSRFKSGKTGLPGLHVET